MFIHYKTRNKFTKNKDVRLFFHSLLYDEAGNSSTPTHSLAIVTPKMKRPTLLTTDLKQTKNYFVIWINFIKIFFLLNNLQCQFISYIVCSYVIASYTVKAYSNLKVNIPQTIRSMILFCNKNFVKDSNVALINFFRN